MVDQHIDIFSGEKKIGHIVTPGGTGGAYANVIQVCGFDEAFDYWGCGLFGTDKDANAREGLLGPVYTKSYDHKRDIQLIFSEYDAARTEAVMAQATIATRNVRDFRSRGIPIINPWEGSRPSRPKSEFGT